MRTDKKFLFAKHVWTQQKEAKDGEACCSFEDLLLKLALDLRQLRKTTRSI